MFFGIYVTYKYKATVINIEICDLRLKMESICQANNFCQILSHAHQRDTHYNSPSVLVYILSGFRFYHYYQNIDVEEMLSD